MVSKKEEAAINTQDYIEEKNCFFKCSILFLRQEKTYVWLQLEIYPISTVGRPDCRYNTIEYFFFTLIWKNNQSLYDSPNLSN